MNLLLLKQLSIISSFAGAIFGLLTLMPWVGLFTFLILITCISAFIIVYLKKYDLIGIMSLRDGCIYGALIGFISFIAFSVVYTPISMLLGWLISSYSQGFLRFFLTGGFGSFFVLLMLIIFAAGMSALFNACAGLATAYVYELITGVKKGANENTSIDFEIK